MGMGNRLQSDTWWGHSLNPIPPNLLVLGVTMQKTSEMNFTDLPLSNYQKMARTIVCCV